MLGRKAPGFGDTRRALRGDKAAKRNALQANLAFLTYDAG